MYAVTLALLLSACYGTYSCPDGVVLNEVHYYLQHPPLVTRNSNSATAFVSISEEQNVSLHIQESSGKCFNCSIDPAPAAQSGSRFLCSSLPLSKDFNYVYLVWNDQRISKQPYIFDTYPQNDSNVFPGVVAGITAGVLLIVLCLISVILVSVVIGAAVLRKRKEKLSCEAIKSHRDHMTQTKEQEKTKQKILMKKQWSDWDISPPIPPPTEDMLMFDPVNRLIVSTEITIIADIHSSESDNSVFQGGSETPGHFSSFPISSKNSDITDSPISSRQSSESSTTCLLDNKPSYENTSLEPASDHTSTPPMTNTHNYVNVPNPPQDSPAPKVTHPQSYENVPQNDSPLLNYNTPPPPPIPHSTKHHTFYIASTSIHHHDNDDDHEQSRTLNDTEYNDKVNVDEFLGRPQRSGESDEEDDTSQESLDMWPPPIPQRTEEMYFMKDSAESAGDHLVYDEQIDMKQNVAYKTFMKNNV